MGRSLYKLGNASIARKGKERLFFVKAKKQGVITTFDTPDTEKVWRCLLAKRE
jgi:hypothetical protein